MKYKAKASYKKANLVSLLGKPKHYALLRGDEVEITTTPPKKVLEHLVESSKKVKTDKGEK